MISHPTPTSFPFPLPTSSSASSPSVPSGVPPHSVWGSSPSVPLSLCPFVPFSLSEFFSPPTANRWTPPLTIIASLACTCTTAHAEATPPTEAAPIFWIGRAVWPTPWLLAQLSITNPSIFIDPPDHTTLLWTVDQCLRTGGSRIVIADGSRMNMTATRRLQLASESMHASCFLARPHSDLSQLSAAARRWFITPHPSDNDLPAWRMQLLRDRSSSLLSGMESPVWLIRTTRHAPQSQAHHVILNSRSCPFHLSAELVDRSAVPPLRTKRYAFA